MKKIERMFNTNFNKNAIEGELIGNSGRNLSKFQICSQ